MFVQQPIAAAMIDWPAGQLKWDDFDSASGRWDNKRPRQYLKTYIMSVSMSSRNFSFNVVWKVQPLYHVNILFTLVVQNKLFKYSCLIINNSETQMILAGKLLLKDELFSTFRVKLWQFCKVYRLLSTPALENWGSGARQRPILWPITARMLHKRCTQRRSRVESRRTKRFHRMQKIQEIDAVKDTLTKLSMQVIVCSCSEGAKIIQRPKNEHHRSLWKLLWFGGARYWWQLQFGCR